MTPLQATKWIGSQALLELDELKYLFNISAAFSIIPTGRVIEAKKRVVPRDDFFHLYETYINRLKEGEVLITQEMREAFSSVLTLESEALFDKEVALEKIIVRPKLPVIQMQLSSFHFSEDSQKIFPQVFGKDTISWGLYFSFPQLYLNHDTGDALKSRTTPNGELFHAFQKWMREYTLPTSFLRGDTKIATPLRLGKKCVSWINSHPQLKALKVLT